MSQAEIAALRIYHNACMAVPWQKNLDPIDNVAQGQRSGLAAVRAAGVDASLVAAMDAWAREELAGLADGSLSWGDG